MNANYWIQWSLVAIVIAVCILFVAKELFNKKKASNSACHDCTDCPLTPKCDKRRRSNSPR